MSIFRRVLLVGPGFRRVPPASNLADTAGHLRVIVGGSDLIAGSLTRAMGSDSGNSAKWVRNSFCKYARNENAVVNTRSVARSGNRPFESTCSKRTCNRGATNQRIAYSLPTLCLPGLLCFCVVRYSCKRAIASSLAFASTSTVRFKSRQHFGKSAASM